MKILFRADASMEIGSGHIMRCMVLAEELKNQGAECTFICSNGDGNLIDKIRNHGFAVHNICSQNQKSASVAQGREDNPTVWAMHPFDEKCDAEQTIFLVAGQIFDWVVVDHYSLGKNWDVIIKSICRKLMVIDDLANRHHDCDLLLDQNYYKNLHKRYQKLVPESCICLLGPNYVLLRQEFIEAKNNLRKRTGEIKRVLVFFGGSDSTNETKKILIALKKINLEKIEIDIVVGGANPHHEIIHEICSDIVGVNYYRNVSNMAALISEADIAIGAGGSSIWERCYLGLPSITSVVALNQKEATEDVASLGAIEYLGAAEVLTHEDYAAALLKFLGDYESVRIMSIAGRNLVNRVGTTAVVNTMQKIYRE